MKIGVTDSGIGGLNVLASLIKEGCGDEYLYLADGANLPYGNKSPDRLKEIAVASAERLIDQGANVVVFGCNTLSVTALEYVRKRVPNPVFGLRPRPELLCGPSLLMTTPTTALFLPKTNKNVSLLTPAFLAEILDEEYPSLQGTIAYLSPLLVPYGNVRTVALGCSHYLYAKEVIRTLLPQAKITDGVAPLSSLIGGVLPRKKVKDPSIEFLFTGKRQPARYAEILSQLLT